MISRSDSHRRANKVSELHHRINPHVGKIRLSMPVPNLKRLSMPVP